MLKLGRKIVKCRIPIFILSLLLLIPAGIGYINTRVNYDVLYYLPDEIETMQGQDILVDEFGTGAYSMFICEGMENKDVAALKWSMYQKLFGTILSLIFQYRWKCCRKKLKVRYLQMIPR